MNNYITTIIDPKYMQVGGFGHIFYDILTAYIIAKKYEGNIKYVYSPFYSLGDEHHIGNKFNYQDDKITWDSFLQFNKNEININDISELNLQHIEINLCDAFRSINLIDLDKFLKSYTNTLFILTNNNRVYLNEIYHTDRTLYNNIHIQLRTKLKHIYKPKIDNIIKIVAIHIRRGDWANQPLVYDINFIKLIKPLLKNKKYEINVYSLGNRKQLNEITSSLKNLDSNIKFHFNTNIFETFNGIYNADIVLGGHSNFPKIITMFSNNIFIYLPYKDGIVAPLGVNNTFKLYHLGEQLEIYDETHRIETDIHCVKNRLNIISKIESL